MEVIKANKEVFGSFRLLERMSTWRSWGNYSLRNVNCSSSQLLSTSGSCTAVVGGQSAAEKLVQLELQGLALKVEPFKAVGCKALSSLQWLTREPFASVFVAAQE